MQIFLKTPIGLWKFAFSCSLFIGATLCTQPPIFFANLQQLQSEKLKYSKDLLSEELVTTCDNQTKVLTEETQDNKYFDDTQFYTGLAFALAASVLGALANILVTKCSSYSSVLLTFWR